MNEKKSTGWQNVRRQLDDWSKPALIALVKDLYDASPDNRDFLLARFQAEEIPTRGFGKLKLAEARKAIRDYRKATGNLIGTIDLMLTYVRTAPSSRINLATSTSPFTTAWSRC